MLDKIIILLCGFVTKIKIAYLNYKKCKLEEELIELRKKRQRLIENIKKQIDEI